MLNATTTFDKNTNNELKKYNTLKDCFQKIYKQEDNLNKTSIKAYSQIERIEETSKLKDIYHYFAKKMGDLEGTQRKQLVGALNNKIVHGILYQSSQIKKYKTNPQCLEQERNREHASQNETPQTSASQKADKELLLFEMESQAYNKSLLLHFIHSELAWHASALQHLGNLYKEILNIDPYEDIKKDNNLGVGDLKDFYDLDELHRTKTPKDNEEYISENNSKRTNNNDNIQNKEQDQN